jgi:xylulokinase
VRSRPISSKIRLSGRCRCALFTGDNPASLVGMGATAPGNIVISLGTSDTFFAAMPGPKTDPNGFGHVFGNPAGGFMSLICFRNGSLAREALRDRLGLDWSAFDRAALADPRRRAESDAAVFRPGNHAAP